MTRVLRKYTTIPKHLYVNRSADIQLSQIIEEMDRPGYVLVARQMGKTNLLLNAKRELSDSKTLIVYIDLSNVFDDERECYRNIVDSIIEESDVLFETIKTTIVENRTSLQLPPHKEHIKELRLLISTFKGKIVIILDEIDALRTANYSDKIFAQIRSNYFARTNFPEFENLTYILSGVIEPTELIKDRNKSPFNIGEKIYLDDFSFEEHNSFIKKSELQISEEISHEIYNWTSGNPRLTFDICAEVETLIRNNVSIDKDKIKNIVHDKYLNNFDVAPIDHIRELVANNPTIRNAISNIRKGINNISSEVKSKLYLFGIINSDFNNIKIKNKVIDLSLSNEWLLSIDRQTKSLFELGSDAVMKGFDIEGGISMLKEYLESDLNIPNAQRQLSLYYIGYAYHSKLNFAESNEYLLKEIISCDISTDLHYRQKLFIGINYLSQKEFENGEKYLLEIIENYKNTPPYLNALFNLSLGQLEYGFSEFKEKSKLYLLAIIDNADKVELDESDTITIIEYKILSYNYLSYICKNDNDFESALTYIDNAIAISTSEFIPELTYLKYVLLSQKADDILISIAKTIISNSVKFSKSSYEISFKEYNLYKYLLALYEIGRYDVFNDLMSYSLSNIFINKKHESEIYFELGNISKDDSRAIEFYKKIVNEKDKMVVDDILYLSLRNLSILNIDNDKSFELYFNQYLDLFALNDVLFDIEDISTFARAIKYYSDKKNIQRGLELCEIVKSRFVNLTSEMEYESIIIYYWFSNLYYSKKLSDLAISYANKSIKLIESYKDKNKRGSIIDEKGAKLIYDQMNQIKQSLELKKPLTVGKKYGRNEIVKVKFINGIEIKGKYKKFEADIIAERCKIIEI